MGRCVQRNKIRQAEIANFVYSGTLPCADDGETKLCRVGVSQTSPFHHRVVRLLSGNRSIVQGRETTVDTLSAPKCAERKARL